MKGQKTRELGSPDFRHPLRTEDDFDERIDDFPIVSILLSLKSISIKPQLLYEYGAADRLLLSHHDYCNICECGLIKEVFPSSDIELNTIIGAFTLFLFNGDIFSSTIHYISCQKPTLLQNRDFILGTRTLKKYEEGLTIDDVRKYAELGDSQAQIKLGLCYEKGRGVTPNENESIKWFTKAAIQGNHFAQYILGVRFYKGIGVRQSNEKALMWFEKASHGGINAAKNFVGYLRPLIKNDLYNVIEKS